MGRIGYVENRGSVKFGMAGQWICWLWDRIGSTVVANIGNPAIPLMMNGRLIRRATLQIVKSDQAHVRNFRRIADFLGGRHDRPTDKQSHDNRGTAPEINLFDLGLP
jgi:hypothetical protein